MKKIIERDSYVDLYLEYDEKAYNIEHVEYDHALILRRLKDNKTLKVFSDYVSFIVQNNAEGQADFLVSNFSEKDQNGERKVKFQHYKEGPTRLYLEREFKLNSASIEDCRLTNDCYLVQQQGYGGCIYNLNKVSKFFYQVYRDEKVSNRLGENAILVSEIIKSDVALDVMDKITYGINLKTFEITTPIWSDLQQRLISIYTLEQAREKEPYVKNPDLIEATRYWEIKRYLDEIAKQLEPDSVYLDSKRSKVNENFVKKFVKNE